MREFSAILRLCIVLRIAQSFFTPEQQGLGVEVDSLAAGVVLVVGVVLAAWALAAAAALVQLAAW